MKIDTLLLYWVRFLLATQGLFLYLSSLTIYKSKNSEGIKNILVLRISALGDFIFSIPALVLLRKQYPLAKIVLLTATTTNAAQQKVVQAYAGGGELPWISFVKPSIIDDAICIHSFDLNSLRKYLKPKIKDFNPDVAIILAHPGDVALGLFKKIIFLRYIGVRGRIYGWRTRASNSWLRRIQYQAGLYDHHVIAPMLSVAETVGAIKINEGDIKFPLSLDSASKHWVESMWKTYNWISRRVIAVAPGSIQPHKRWPLENFISLCQQLVSNFDVSIVVIGTEDDRDLGIKLEAAIKGEVINLAGEISIAQSACVLSLSTLLVGNDGGAMHLGSAVGCPVVSIVPGIEYPNSIEPWFSRELAVRHQVPCSPCYSFTFCPMGHNSCINELPVYDVYTQCVNVLNKDIKWTAASI